VNTGEPQTEWPPMYWAELRVQKIQTKLHQWASDDPGRQFHDVFNLVCDPALMTLARTAAASTKSGCSKLARRVHSPATPGGAV
jgi:RNA-directed DNA polymerase